MARSRAPITGPPAFGATAILTFGEHGLRWQSARAGDQCPIVNRTCQQRTVRHISPAVVHGLFGSCQAFCSADTATAMPRNGPTHPRQRGESHGRMDTLFAGLASLSGHCQSPLRCSRASCGSTSRLGRIDEGRSDGSSRTSTASYQVLGDRRQLKTTATVTDG